MAKRKYRSSKNRTISIPYWVWLIGLLSVWLCTSIWWEKSPTQLIKDTINVVSGKKTEYRSPSEHEASLAMLQDSIAALTATIQAMNNATPYRKALVDTEANSLNLRTEADLTSKVVIKIPDSSTVEVLYFDEQVLVLDGSPGKWCKIKYADKEGWVWGNYVRLLD